MADTIDRNAEEMAEITLPVSLGEALDKLTILDIKCSKIMDEERRSAAMKEYTVLLNSLEEYVTKYAWHYKVLREINLSIWDQQDKFHGQEGRVKPTEVELGRICSVILDDNDRRFRVKAKINHIAASSLREVKGYAKKKAFVYGHLGLGDMFWLNGAVRYLSTCYDETLVVCKRKYESNVTAIYVDDPTIKFHLIDDDNELFGFTPFHSKIWKANGYDVYACGNHLIDVTGPLPGKPWVYDFPHCFYDDMKLNRSIRQNYFYMPTDSEAESLLRLVKQWSPKYIVVHQQSQNITLAIWDKLAQRVSDPIFDLNKNHYEPGHPYYIIAEIVVNKPLFHYKRLLEEATEIHLLESSVYSMASHLDLSRVLVKKCYDAFDSSNERLGIFDTDTV